jgi:hypothetical protein
MAVAILLLLQVGSAAIISATSCAANLAGQARFNEAIDAGTAFLKGLQGQPWRRHFIYCCFGFYSWNVEATARNNIGAARMQLGEIERAEADLRHAVAKTRTTRCHTFNLAIIAHVQGD